MSLHYQIHGILSLVHYGNIYVPWHSGRLFTNDPGDWGSIPSQVTSKIQKMVLDASLLNTQHSKVWIKGKWILPGKKVVTFPAPWCNSYWNGSLRVTLNYYQPNYLRISWFIVFNVLMSKVAMLKVTLALNKYTLKNQQCFDTNFLNTVVRAPIPADCPPSRPAWRAILFGHLVWIWVMVIFQWLFFLHLSSSTESMEFSDSILPSILII